MGGSKKNKLRDKRYFVLVHIETNEWKDQLGWISGLGVVAAVGPKVTRIRAICDALIDKRRGCIVFEHGPPTESFVGARLICVRCVSS
jgi:hypothetical protein